MCHSEMWLYTQSRHPAVNLHGDAWMVTCGIWFVPPGPTTPLLNVVSHSVANVSNACVQHASVQVIFLDFELCDKIFSVDHRILSSFFTHPVLHIH